MRILKFIGLGLLSIIVLLLIVGFLLPSKVHFERSATIKANPATVFPMVNDLKKWELWSPWYRMDPKMKMTYGDTTEGVGGFYSWDSENSNVGNGTMKIATSTPSDSIKLEMNFMKQGVAYAGFKFAPDGENTKMTWSMDADEGMNPIKRLFAFFLMDKMLGPIFDQGLHNLDSVICAMPKTVTVNYNIEMTTVTALPCLTILDSADMTDAAEIGKKYGNNYMEIGAYLMKNKLKSVGAPFGIMGPMGGTKYIWESAVQTDKLGKSEGRIVAKNSYAGDVAFLKYFGSYMKTRTAYEAIYKWIADNGKTENGNAWEVYVTDPGAEKDTAKWETDIYVPIK
ncbi:MAG: SRPBCC family protein [Bacteroidota bacterium]